MPRAKSVKPEAAPKPEPDVKQVMVEKAEFTRTRDALVTSWVALANALKNATSAYIDHSNAWLGGTVDLDPSMMDLGAFLQSGALVTIGGGPPAAPEKKQRKKAEPRDPNQPKRPLTAYLLWLGENREKIHSELGPDQKRGEISSEGTKRWKLLPEEVKQKYKDAYVASRDVYNKELADYKANGAPIAATSPDADDDEDDEDAEAEDHVQVAAPAESDDSEDDSTSDDEKEPTPPPVKTPKSALKGGRKKAAAPASSPPLPTSSPTKKGAFTAVNGSNKRKSKTTDAEAVAEEPKKKRGRKAKEEEAPASTPAEVPASAKKDKKEKRKGRKSVGGDA